MTLARIALASILIIPGAWAQRQGGGGGGYGRGGGGDMGRYQMPASVSRLEQISGMLNLNKDQKKDFKAAMDEAQKEATPVHEQIVKSRDVIAEAVGGGKGPDEINQLVSAEAALESQMATIELKAFARLYKALTAEQQPRSTGVLYMLKGVFSSGKNWNSAE